MSHQELDPMSVIATDQLRNKANKKSNWLEAMAEAWAKTLDAKAADITAVADRIRAGEDNPSTLVELNANVQAMSYLTNSTHSSMTSAGEGLNTLARKG